MKFLLDKDEYDELLNSNYFEVEQLEKKIADLCRLIADYELYKDDFKWEPYTDNKCIRDGGRYCTGCPVKDLCTYNNKVYAK